MKAIDRLKRAARDNIESCELFTSRHIVSFYKAKLMLICKMFSVMMPDLTVIFDENSEMTAATSLSHMIINLGHKMFAGTDEQRLLKGAGVLLHEIGHILFTNFTAWVTWMTNIRSGVYWPRTPDVPPELEDARTKLLEMATDKRFGGVFMNTAHSLANCLEDGREENFLFRLVRNARFMLKGLVVLRQETYAECPAFEELAAKVDAGEANPIGAMLQLVIHYARFGEIKGNLDPTHRLGETITEIMPFIDLYLSSKEAVVYYDSFNKMLVHLEVFLEESFEEMKKQAQAQNQPQGQPGAGQSSGAPMQGNGQGAPAGSGSPSPPGSSGSDSSDEGESSDGGEQAGGDSQSEDGSSGNGDNGSQTEEDSSGNAEDSSDMSDEEIAEAIKDMLQNALDKLVGMTVDNGERMDSRAKGSDRGAVKRQMDKLSGIQKGEGGKVATPNAAESAGGSGSVTHSVSSQSDSGVTLTLDDIKRKIADEKTEELADKAVHDEYRKLADEVKDYAEIHKDRDITIYHYSDVSDSDKARYDKIAKEISPLVKRAVKSSNFYERDREPVVKDRLYTGKLDSRRVYRADCRMFKKTKYFEEPPIVALAVRVDMSGSMSGSKERAALRTCIFLYEYTLEMQKRYNVNIPLYIYGDCVSREAPGVNMYVFADNRYATPTEKYRLMKLDSGGCNRDGLPVRMAVKRLEELHPQASKVLFNITDGQPNDRGYGGEEAFADLRDITKHCERKHIALAACAVGDDRDVIEEIYGKDHFLNISDLDELPMRLVKILKRLLKN